MATTNRPPPPIPPLTGKRKNLNGPPIPNIPFAPQSNPPVVQYPAVGEPDDIHKINISVEFGIPKYAPTTLFKSLLQKMFAVNRTMYLLHWVPNEGSVITRARDIPTNTDTLAPIFLGVETQPRFRSASWFI